MELIGILPERLAGTYEALNFMIAIGNSARADELHSSMAMAMRAFLTSLLSDDEFTDVELREGIKELVDIIGDSPREFIKNTNDAIKYHATASPFVRKIVAAINKKCAGIASKAEVSVDDETISIKVIRPAL